MQSYTLGILTNSINPLSTSGTINIGEIATNTVVHIAAQASRSSVLRLGDGASSSGDVHVLNGNNASGDVRILDGSYTGTNVKGDFNLQNNASVSASSTGGSCSIQTGSGNGLCTIGNSLSTTIINSGITNISNGGMAATDKVNICGGTNASGSELFLGSTSLTRAFLRGIDVNINHQRVGNINIGADTVASITNILGTTNLGSTSKVLTVNAPIAIGYSTSALTLNTQIGRTVRTILATQTGIPNGGKLLSSITVGTAGVYAFTYGLRYSGATTVVGVCQSWFQFQAGDDTQYGSQATFYNPTALMDTNILFQSGTSIVTITSTSTIQFRVYIIYSGGAPQLDGTSSYYSYTRIA